MAKYELQNINNQIAILNRDIYTKRNEIAYLHFGAQELEGYVHGLKNHNQQQQEMKYDSLIMWLELHTAILLHRRCL